MKRKVVVLKVSSYNLDLLKFKIREALERYFPLEELFSYADTVLLKPNLLMVSSPEAAITTHPLFIEAIGQIFREAGFKVCIADNSGNFGTTKDMDEVYKGCGLKEVALRNNFELLYPEKTYLIDNIPFSWWTKEFIIINLPKLKTHELTILSLATKNLYGCINGLYKSYLHKLYPKTNDFVEILIKLYHTIKPKLNIVDGIVSLEGEGPATKGRPKRTELVIIGDDTLYTDYVISEIINLPPRVNPLIKRAQQNDLLDLDKLEVIYELDQNKIKDFKFPSTYILNYFPHFIIKLASFLFKLQPKIDKIKCTGCRDCLEVCPNNAIILRQGIAVIDYSKCILCMCCYEVCRFGAVDIKKSFPFKLLHR